MQDHFDMSDQILHTYKCARCKNTFEAVRHFASTCPICGYSGSENLSSEADITSNN